MTATRDGSGQRGKRLLRDPDPEEFATYPYYTVMKMLYINAYLSH